MRNRKTILVPTEVLEVLERSLSRLLPSSRIRLKRNPVLIFTLQHNPIGELERESKEHTLT